MLLKKLSVSPANTFKQCPRKFFFEYVEGYERANKPKFLMLGSAYDDLLAVFDVEGPEGVYREAPNKLEGHDLIDFLFIFDKYYLPYAETNKFPPIEGGNQFGFGFEAYPGAGWKITGYLDKVSEVDVGGAKQHVVVERKTTTEPIETNSAYWNKLDLDPQIRSYVWAMKQKGFRAGWVCYEVIRKINSALVSGLDRSLPLDKYKASLEAWFVKNGHKKTVVANKMFYVTQEMCDEFVEEQVVTRGMIVETANASHTLKDAGFSPISAWLKHEGSCNNFGGCCFLPVCKKETGLENPVFSKTHKVLE